MPPAEQLDDPFSYFRTFRCAIYSLTGVKHFTSRGDCLNSTWNFIKSVKKNIRRTEKCPAVKYTCSTIIVCLLISECQFSNSIWYHGRLRYFIRNLSPEFTTFGEQTIVFLYYKQVVRNSGFMVHSRVWKHKKTRLYTKYSLSKTSFD